MLDLNRKVEVAIYISVRVEVKILRGKGNHVSVGTEVPEEVSVVRSELEDLMDPALDNRAEPRSELMLRCSAI